VEIVFQSLYEQQRQILEKYLYRFEQNILNIRWLQFFWLICQQPLYVKVVVVGDHRVVKTELLNGYTACRIAVETQKPQESCTIFDNFITHVEVDSQFIALDLHESVCRKEYSRLRILGYEGVDVVLLCYSVVDDASYCNVEQHWIQEVQQYCPSAVIIVLATKTDLRDNKNNNMNNNNTKYLTKEDGDRLAKKI